MESFIFVSVPNKGVELQFKVDLQFYLSQTVVLFKGNATNAKYSIFLNLNPIPPLCKVFEKIGTPKGK